jgi:hypothetical protein
MERNELNQIYARLNRWRTELMAGFNSLPFASMVQRTL